MRGGAWLQIQVCFGLRQVFSFVPRHVWYCKEMLGILFSVVLYISLLKCMFIFASFKFSLTLVLEDVIIVC